MSLNVNSHSKINNRRIFDSDIEAMQTKEFRRRRLLRLQQVREQSRHIAKKVRERVENENLRQLARIDQTKRDKFGQSRDTVVKELRSRCSDNIQQLGVGHSDAARETIARKEEECRRRSNDKSSERAKTAASLLRQSQHLLDETKEKTLQRKLQARSLANERSRQNFNKLKSSKQVSETSKHIDHKDSNEEIKLTDGKVVTKHTSNDGKCARTQKPVKHLTENIINHNAKPSLISPRKSSGKNKDMESPWVEGANAKLPAEWLSNAGKPSSDKPHVREVSQSTEKKKRDLFTVSEEMPKNLQGGVSEESAAPSRMESAKRPSINMVSSYLQERAKRLPNTATRSGFNRVSGEEMRSLKETIIRSKKLDMPAANSGGLIDSRIICQVTDSQAVPVPCWKPVVVKVSQPVAREDRTESPLTLNMNFDEFGSRINDDEKCGDEFGSRDPVISTKQSPVRSRCAPRSPPSPRSPVTTSRLSVPKSGKSSCSRKSKESTASSTCEGRHNVVTQYDHRTRAVTDVARGGVGLVTHEPSDGRADDAFTLAARESAEVVVGGGAREEKASRRSGDAAYKQKVEREYKDMMRNLKGISKEKSGPINSAFMDDTRQMMAKAMQQRKMAEEFEKMQRETEARKSVGQRVSIKSVDSPAKQRQSRNQERRSHQPARLKTTQVESDNNRPYSPAKRPSVVIIENSSNNKPVDSSKEKSVKDGKRDTSPSKAVKNASEAEANRRAAKRYVSPKSVIIRNQSSVKFNLKNDKSSYNDSNDNYCHCKEDDSDRRCPTDLSRKPHENNADKGESDAAKTDNVRKHPDKTARRSSESPHMGKGDFSNSEYEDADSDDPAKSELSNAGSWRRQSVAKKVRAARLPARRFARTSSLESKRDVSERGNDTYRHQKIQESKLARVASPNTICMKIIEVCHHELVQRPPSPSPVRKRPPKEQRKRHHGKPQDISNSASDELYNLMAGIVERRAKEKRAAGSVKGRGQTKNSGGHGRDRKVLDWDVGACEVGSTTDDQSSHMVPKNLKTSAIHPCPTWLLMNQNVKCIHIAKTNPQHDSTTAAAQPSVSQTTSAATFKTAQDSQSKSVTEAKMHKAKSRKETQDKSPTTCITKNIEVSSDNRQSLDGFEVIIQLKKKTANPSTKATPIPVNMPKLPSRLASFSSSSSTAYMSPPDKIVPKLLNSNTLTVLSEKNNNVQERGPTRTYEDLDKQPTQDRSQAFNGGKADERKDQKLDIIVLKKTTSVASVQTEKFEEKNVDSNDAECSCEPLKKKRHSPCRRGTSIEGKTSEKLSQDNKNRKVQMKSPKKTSEPATRVVYHEPIKRQSTEKARLNPEVRKYIDELLELGRDHIQDIELTNSTVTTPCNSIINMPSNQSIADQHEKNKRRAKINDFLKKNEPILNAITMNNKGSNSKCDLQTVIIQNRYALPQPRSKKSLRTSSTKAPITHDVDDVIKQIIVKAKPKLVKPKPKVVINTGRRRIKSLPIKKNLNRYFKSTGQNELRKSAYFMPALRFTTSEIIKGKSPKRRKHLSNNHSRSFPIGYLHEPDMDSEKSHKSAGHQLTVKPCKSKSPKRTVNKSSMTTDINYVNKVTSVNDIHNTNPSSTRTAEEDESSKIFNNLIDSMNAVRQGQMKQEQMKGTKQELMTRDVGRDKSPLEHHAGLNKMEKFAELTEKCTKRLSTLAKVLDEVRKNKLNIFDDILGSESGGSEEGRQNASTNVTKSTAPSVPNEQSPNKFFLLPNSVDGFSENVHKKKMENFIPFLSDLPKPEESKARMNNDFKESSSRDTLKSSTDSRSLLKTKPPPAMTRITLKNAPELIPHELSTVMEVESPLSIRTESMSRDRTPIILKFNNEKSESSICINLKSTPLARVVEHELDRRSSETRPSLHTSGSSEAKSKEPSLKDTLENYSAEISTSKSEETRLKDLSKRAVEGPTSKSKEPSLNNLSKHSGDTQNLKSKEPSLNNLSKHSGDTQNLETKVEYSIKRVPSPVNLPQPEKAPTVEAAQDEPRDLVGDKNFSMMDVDKFKEIMMKPFITYEEYARQCNKSDREEISLGDDTTPTPKLQSVKEEISSINSEGTLPDIIAELLKRNIIDEPFAFDKASKVTSSQSSLTDSSVSLVDSVNNLRKEKVISSSKLKSQSEKTSKRGDSDDSRSSTMTKASLSATSQADLEVVLEKLGMCWASSTLKKTKQSLALSSSSSSSKNIMERKSQMATFQKLKRNKSLLREISRLMNSNPDINSILVDIFNDTSSVSSAQNVTDDTEKENLKVTEATNTVTSNMTQTDGKKVLSVKDYLTREMADKITFSNQTPQNDSNNEHFTSLYSTKLTNLYKSKVEDLRKNDECSGDRTRPRSRQRTSTPVQLFKSLTFNSSSSSCNNSNGLFSNVEDLSSVKAQSHSVKNSSVTDKDELTIPNLSLKPKKSSSSSS